MTALYSLHLIAENRRQILFLYFILCFYLYTTEESNFVTDCQMWTVTDLISAMKVPFEHLSNNTNEENMHKKREPKTQQPEKQVINVTDNAGLAWNMEYRNIWEE